MNVERAFHDRMIEVYRRAKEECGYNATRFLQMVQEFGGTETARRLLQKRTPSDGLTELWRKNRLDLSVERQVLQPEFESLFTEDERATARRILADYGFEC